MVALRPAIVSAATHAARHATSSIPIVMVGVSDPIAEGFVGDLGHPGGNITRTSTQSNAVVGKVLELTRQILPRAARIAILWDPMNAISRQLRLGETLIAAARLHLLARLSRCRPAPGTSSVEGSRCRVDRARATRDELDGEGASDATISAGDERNGIFDQAAGSADIRQVRG